MGLIADEFPTLLGRKRASIKQDARGQVNRLVSAAVHRAQTESPADE